MASLVADHLQKSYPIAGGHTLEVLRDACLEIRSPGSVAIVGPSGSGKSTFLSILGTLERPTSGRFEIDGVDPTGLGERELASFRARKIGFVFQEHHLLPQCSVLENVLVPLLADGSASGEDAARARRLIDRVGLGPRVEHLPGQLSGGERQRAAIARALIRGPAVLLADEPTGNLDRTTATSVTDLLLELQREQGTILVAVTHSRALADRLGSRFELDDGCLKPISGSV